MAVALQSFVCYYISDPGHWPKNQYILMTKQEKSDLKIVDVNAKIGIGFALLLIAFVLALALLR